MISRASAPGKTILFGEHSVIFGKPAIAVAVDLRAQITIKSSKNKISTVKSNDLNFKAELDFQKAKFDMIKGKSGIVNYIFQALLNNHDGSPIDVELDLSMPIGAGLGSSAAVTVATIAALENYHHENLNISDIVPTIASKAHQVEIIVQGTASPLDTSVSSFGGLIYLSDTSKVAPLNLDLDGSLVIGYTSSRGNTAKMIADVQKLRDANPEIIDAIIDTMGKVTQKAHESLISGNAEHLGELMNINQGLLDSLGVNTLELSKMIYLARQNGALGSKITGAGGGGSILAYCPGKVDDVLEILKKSENAIQANFSKYGVIIHE